MLQNCPGMAQGGAVEKLKLRICKEEMMTAMDGQGKSIETQV